MRTAFSLISLLASLAACGGDDPAAPPPPDAAVAPSWDGGSSTAIEQLRGECAESPSTLGGRADAGTGCVRATDCAPSCCACPAGPKHWLGAACIHGTCADEAAACAETKDDAALCGGG